MDKKWSTKLPQAISETQNQIGVLSELFNKFRNTEKLLHKQHENNLIQLKNSTTKDREQILVSFNKLTYEANQRQLSLDATKVEIENIIRDSTQTNNLFQVTIRDNQSKIAELAERVDMFKLLLKQAEEARMEKYYGQVAKLDYQFRQLRERVSDNSDLQLQQLKYLSVTLPIITHNQICDGLNKSLKGEVLNSFIDHQKSQIDLLDRKRTNAAGMSRDDQLTFGRQFLSKTATFVKLPQKSDEPNMKQ